MEALSPTYTISSPRPGPRPGAAAAAAAHVPARAARPILVEPGTCIVFDKDLLHRGGPNLSSAIRYALYARMRYA